MKRLLFIAAALATASAPLRGEDFIRVDEDKKAARLQTGITRFEKNGATVDLIGAVHIGDKAYYDLLDERFKTYEVLLFEMIGGENINAPAPAPAPDPEAEKEEHVLRVIYNKAAAMLALVGQTEHIDYTAKNFVHADLTAAEFSEKQSERGESMLKILLDTEDVATQPNPLRLIYALVSRRPDLLKLSLIKTMGDGDDQIAALAGENVIIGDRNIRCLEVLSRELVAGRKNIGIFYGAAHFPDMEKRLIEQGFTPTKHEWITAWNVLKPLKKTVAEP